MFPQKNEVHWGKNEIHRCFPCFYDFLLKILKDDFPIGMIQFRKFFEMIFVFENAIFQKIQAMIFISQ